MLSNDVPLLPQCLFTLWFLSMYSMRGQCEMQIIVQTRLHCTEVSAKIQNLNVVWHFFLKKDEEGAKESDQASPD